jgi:hypothetical protein
LLIRRTVQFARLFSHSLGWLRHGAREREYYLLFRIESEAVIADVALASRSLLIWRTDISADVCSKQWEFQLVRGWTGKIHLLPDEWRGAPIDIIIRSLI